MIECVSVRERERERERKREIVKIYKSDKVTLAEGKVIL